jgi:hypothetical protein
MANTPPLAPPRKRGGGLDFQLNRVFRGGLESLKFMKE